MTKPETLELLGMVAGCFSSFKVSESAESAWHLLLGQYPMAEVKPALIHVLQSPNEFPPTPGSVLTAMKVMKYPELAMSAAEHCAKGTPTWDRIVKRDGRLNRPYNPNGDGITTKEVEFIERHLTKQLQEELDRLQQAGLQELAKEKLLGYVPQPKPAITHQTPKIEAQPKNDGEDRLRAQSEENVQLRMEIARLKADVENLKASPVETREERIARLKKQAEDLLQ